MLSFHEIEFEVSDVLSGELVGEVVDTIAAVVACCGVAVARAEGAGPRFARVFGGAELRIFSLDEFRALVVDVQQFDWGDFYLLNHADALSEIESAAAYAVLIPRAVATVRAVDDTYIYVYARDSRVADEVVSKFPGCTRRTANLEDLTFPS